VGNSARFVKSRNGFVDGFPVLSLPLWQKKLIPNLRCREFYPVKLLSTRETNKNSLAKEVFASENR
jgi:hypothetical protein